MDVFLAASKIGPHGQAIGLDMSAVRILKFSLVIQIIILYFFMSQEMIKRARDNAKKQNLRPPKVAFIQAHLTEPLPIASDSINCVLSNCVINLLPLDGKASVFKEVYRVLKPGGRFCFHDVRHTKQVCIAFVFDVNKLSDYCEAGNPGCYTQRFGILCRLHLWRYSDRSIS